MKVITNTDIRKAYKRKTNNKLGYYGDTDINKKVMQVNKSKKLNKKKGDILDTIVHEAAHAKHPKMHEKNIRVHTKKLTKRLNRKQKKSYYNLFT